LSCDEETQRKGIVGIMWMKGGATPMPEQDEVESKSMVAMDLKIM
jgi:hypothetical protein